MSIEVLIRDTGTGEEQTLGVVAAGERFTTTVVGPPLDASEESPSLLDRLLRQRNDLNERIARLAPDARDEMAEHFIDANERMGEALVKIGLALGLPRPPAQDRWGTPEILDQIIKLWAQIPMEPPPTAAYETRYAACDCDTSVTTEWACYACGAPHEGPLFERFAAARTPDGAA
jgi:hypothetical protein